MSITRTGFAPSVAAVIALFVVGAQPGARGAPAQEQSLGMASGALVVLRAGTADTRSFVPPAPVAKIGGRAATISVTYNGFSAQAQTAFQAAVDVWAAQLTSSVPITITANWTPLASNVLGSAGPVDYWRNFSGAPVSGTWYPVALANKLAGSDIDTSQADIDCSFNSNQSRWYYGTDGQTPSGQYDLMSVVLHEIGHGLGFIGSMTVTGGGLGNWGSGTSFPFIYDRFAENGSGQSLIDTTLFAKPSAALASQLTGGSLFFDGTQTRAANSGSPARLYAPSSWESGSSYSHLDESTYGVGNANSLMTPVLNSAEAIHDPGAITRAMFQDMGWTASGTSATCSYSISPSSQSLSASGGTGTVTVTTQTGCAWTATSGVSWLSITAGASGTGSGTVTFSASANTSTASRTGTLTIAGNTFTVTQSGVTSTASTRGNLRLNSDTNADAFTYREPTGIWSMERGNGAGAFSPLAGAWSAGWTVRAADFNGDGLTDFFLYNTTTGQWFKAINAGNGTFTYFTSAWSAGWTPYVLDLNGDGKSDVFLYNAATGAWFTCTSTGDGTGEFLYGPGLWSVAWQVYAADLNGDGRGDLFLYNITSGVWFRVTIAADGTFSYYSESWSANWNVTIGDYDGDGRSDVFLYAAASGLYFVCWNNGTTFTYSSDTTITGAIVVAGFFDGDSRADLFLYNPVTGEWRMLTDQGTGGGTWSSGWQVFVTDLNGDGKSDIVLYSTTLGTWFQCLTTGVGAFSYTSGTWATGLTVVTSQTRLP